MNGRWEDVDELMVAMAGEDLAGGRDVVPMLTAFAGEDLRFFAFLRSFEKGCHEDPLIELLALAMPLDADRIATSFSGRVWSFDDPIPPVGEDGDLRQRALVCTFVDGARGRARETTVIHPFDLDERGRPTWLEPQRLDGGVGFVPAALTLAVRQRRRLRSDDATIREQAVRCLALGHDLHLAPDVQERVAAAGALQR